MIRRPPGSTLFPSTTLFRSALPFPRCRRRRTSHVTSPRRAIAALLSVTGAVAALAACGDSAAAEGDVLTVYSAQHESLVRTMVEGFTEETGIELEFRDANDSELANQIVQEGEASPADVFLTENSPAIDRKSTRLNSSHANISYAVFCLKKKTRGRT